jgi:hypothetical protein
MSDPARNARASTAPVEPTYNRNPARNPAHKPAENMNPPTKSATLMDSIYDGPLDRTKAVTSFRPVPRASCRTPV